MVDQWNKLAVADEDPDILDYYNSELVMYQYQILKTTMKK